MMVIKPDYERRIDIPGVPAPVRRPVDIDQATTGFTILRTLRIYRFDPESVIEGHAEEDEVFLIVLAGAVGLTITEDGTVLSATLSAADGAYLPPHAAYKLVALTEADVAYARATPSGAHAAKVFCSAAKLVAPGVTVLLDEAEYGERLRLRLVRFDAQTEETVFAPVSLIGSEALVHVRIHPHERVSVVHQGQAAWLDSDDTITVAPGDEVSLHVPQGSSGLALIVMGT